MLFCTSLVTTVALSDAKNSTSPRRLQIVNTKRESTICELSFPSTILNVRLNRRRLVVVLDAALFVYDISNMKLLHTIDTGPNPDGLCSLSPSSERCYVAYTAHVTSPSGAEGGATGSVVLYDLLTLSMANVIPAHRGRIACLALNAAGTLLATASEKGTVIRVFSVPDGKPLYQFRRGSYAARIYSLTFNAASTLLCVTSDTETVHLFKLAPSAGRVPDDPESAVQRKRNASFFGAWREHSVSLGKNVAGSVGGYLPSTLTEMWEPQRDFAFLKLPTPGVRAVAAVSKYVSRLTQHASAGHGPHLGGALVCLRAGPGAGRRVHFDKTYVLLLTQNTRCWIVQAHSVSFYVQCDAFRAKQRASRAHRSTAP